MDTKARLDQIYKQLETLKKDPNALDRDAQMRRLRKEKRKLETELGIREQVVSERKEKQQPVSSDGTAKKRRRRDSQKRTRELANIDRNYYKDAPRRYAETIPEKLIEELVSLGLKDRRSDPRSLQEGALFAFSIKLTEYEQPAQVFIDKFMTAWGGTKPLWFTTIKQGPYQMLAFAPLPKTNSMTVKK